MDSYCISQVYFTWHSGFSSSHVLLRIWVFVPFYCWVVFVPLDGYTTVCLLILLLTNIWGYFHFELISCRILLWTFVFMWEWKHWVTGYIPFYLPTAMYEACDYSAPLTMSNVVGRFDFSYFSGWVMVSCTFYFYNGILRVVGGDSMNWGQNMEQDGSLEASSWNCDLRSRNFWAQASSPCITWDLRPGTCTL